MKFTIDLNEEQLQNLNIRAGLLGQDPEMVVKSLIQPYTDSSDDDFKFFLELSEAMSSPEFFAELNDMDIEEDDSDEDDEDWDEDDEDWDDDDEDWDEDDEDWEEDDDDDEDWDEDDEDWEDDDEEDLDEEIDGKKKSRKTTAKFYLNMN